MKKFFRVTSKSLLILFCLGTALFASENCKTLYTGAAAYKAGDFTSAAEAWQNCIDNGYSDADLFYNLGNAYFREGRIGLSILNYEKALRRNPTNEDYIYNLKFAKSLTKDKVEADEEENPILEFLFRAHHFFSLKKELFIALGIVWAIMIVQILKILLVRPRARLVLSLLTIPLALCLGVLVCSAGYKIYREKTYSAGIVIAESADVTSGPSDKSQTLNMLSEGTSVEVLDLKDGWAHVRLGEKINGFIKLGELGIVK